MKKGQRPHEDWTYEGFPLWLRSRIDERGWTIAQLAEAMGVSNGLISRWMQGKHQPSRKSLVQVARALEVSKEEVLIAAGYLDENDATDDPLRLELLELLKHLPLTHERYVTLNALLRAMAGVPAPAEMPESRRHPRIRVPDGRRGSTTPLPEPTAH